MLYIWDANEIKWIADMLLTNTTYTTVKFPVFPGFSRFLPGFSCFFFEPKREKITYNSTSTHDIPYYWDDTKSLGL